MERHRLVDQLKRYGELGTGRNTKVWIGEKVIERVLYFNAAVSRGFHVNPRKYYVFVSDKGHVYECDTPASAVDTALDNVAFDYTMVENGDYVDFGAYGQFYICGENIDGSKFLVTRSPDQRGKRTEDGFYLEKGFAKDIIEKYEF